MTPDRGSSLASRGKLFGRQEDRLGEILPDLVRGDGEGGHEVDVPHAQSVKHRPADPGQASRGAVQGYPLH